MSSKNNKERRRPFFELSRGVGAFVIAITLLAGGFALISPTPMTAALAQEENNTTASATISNTTTTASASSSSLGMELSPQPVYQEREKLVSQIPINQTHFQVIVTGNGTVSLPNNTQTIRTTSTKSGIVSMMDGTFAGKEILTTEDGSENATAIVYEIVRFNIENGNGRGIAIAHIHTNSTGMLAPLDGMILAGHDELYPDGTGLLTLWEWQSGIPYVKMPSDLTQQSQMDATTNTTTSSSQPSSTVIP